MSIFPGSPHLLHETRWYAPVGILFTMKLYAFKQF